MRFQRLSARSQQLSGMKAVQEKRVLIEKTKADRLQEQAGKAAESEDRTASDETLLDLLEASLAAPPRSTRPA